METLISYILTDNSNLYMLLDLAESIPVEEYHFYKSYVRTLFTSINAFKLSKYDI